MSPVNVRHTLKFVQQPCKDISRLVFLFLDQDMKWTAVNAVNLLSFLSLAYLKIVKWFDRLMVLILAIHWSIIWHGARYSTTSLMLFSTIFVAYLLTLFCVQVFFTKEFMDSFGWCSSSMPMFRWWSMKPLEWMMPKVIRRQSYNK